MLGDKTFGGPRYKTAYKHVLTLTISNFTAEYAGTYVCVSSNAVASKEKTIRVYCKFNVQIHKNYF